MDYYIEYFEKVWNDNRIDILYCEIEDLTSILSSNKLKNGSQQTVWQVIHDWVIANKENRLKYFPKLFKENIQFDRLTKQYVERKIFKNMIFMLLPLNFQTDLKNFVKHVNFQVELNNDSFNLPNLSPVIKNCHQKLLCINTSNGYFEIYDQRQNIWHSSSLLLQPPDEQHYSELALLGNMLYAFGMVKNNNATNQMWSRDLSDPWFQWTAKADMNQSRKLFCSVVLNDTIYALGGWDTINNNQYLRSCERYNIQLNEWSTVADMNSSHTGASATVFNGCIYIAGGWDGEGVLKSVEKYCSQTDTWSEVAPMTTARKHFALTPFAGHLWAIGGLDGDNQPLSRCESYDPVTDTWRMAPTMKEKRWEHKAVEINGELYVVGGGNKCKKENEILRLVDPISVVEKFVSKIGWIRNSTLKKKFSNFKLIVAPSACSNIFKTDSK